MEGDGADAGYCGVTRLVGTVHDVTGATAKADQSLRYVLNAASDADADGRLATDGAFDEMSQGDDHMWSASASDPITRIDWITSVDRDTERTRLNIRAGVLA